MFLKEKIKLNSGFLSLFLLRWTCITVGLSRQSFHASEAKYHCVAFFLSSSLFNRRVCPPGWGRSVILSFFFIPFYPVLFALPYACLFAMLIALSCRLSRLIFVSNFVLLLFCFLHITCSFLYVSSPYLCICVRYPLKMAELVLLGRRTNSCTETEKLNFRLWLFGCRLDSQISFVSAFECRNGYAMVSVSVHTHRHIAVLTYLTQWWQWFVVSF